MNKLQILRYKGIVCWNNV